MTVSLLEQIMKGNVFVLFFFKEALGTCALTCSALHLNAYTVDLPHIHSCFFSLDKGARRQSFLPLWSNRLYLRHKDLVLHLSPETANSI